MANIKMACPNCGKPMDEDPVSRIHGVRFWLCNCGHQDEDHCVTCKSCGKWLTEEEFFSGEEKCPHCGKPFFEISCPTEGCLAMINVQAEKCEECGRNFKVAPCPYCNQLTVFAEEIDACPYCDNFFDQRCRCGAPHRGIHGQKCLACGKYV